MRDSLTSEIHRPVLVDEVVRHLQVKSDGYYIDGTVGAGGHLEAILRSGGASGQAGFDVPAKFLAIDCDAHILEAAKRRLQERGVGFLHGIYDDLETAVGTLGVAEVDGILLDLGVSSLQFDDASRGFSFMKEAPLDMRMDIAGDETAADLIAESTAEELFRILRTYGEEPFAGRISRSIVESRRRRRISTTTQLAEIVARAIPRKAWPRRIHPATRTFQALRIAVNRELEHLERFLQKVPRFLKREGRVAVIAYHSLEDRLVKRSFQQGEREGVLKRVTKKPIVPTEEEIFENPRARSAKLRVAERTSREAS